MTIRPRSWPPSMRRQMANLIRRELRHRQRGKRSADRSQPGWTRDWKIRALQGEMQPYSINHNVTHGEWATKDCQTCHGDDSRVTTPMLLADRLPGGVMPAFVSDESVSLGGDAGT